MESVVTTAAARPGVRVRSSLPDRLRLEVPRVVADERLAGGVEAELRALPGVAHVSVNAVTGRALVVLAAPQDDVEGLLGRIAALVERAQPLDAPLARLDGAAGQDAGGELWW